MPQSPERNYRDSVHNIIRIGTSSAEGRLIVKLIDSAEFQRLRRVRQLGLAHFAYQSAEHSRFTHSLGALHLATRVLDRLVEKCVIRDEDRTAVRVAALLHDIGHGPFSHVVEGILKFHHENYTVEAVTSLETEVGRLLAGYSPELPARVSAIIRGDFKPLALAQLVSSQLDVDRMDYLLRDSLMTGVKYGVFDLEWIIKSIEIDEGSDRIYVSARGTYAVEDYLQARYYMFRQVYFHRTLRAAEAVLRALLRRALHLFQSGQPIWYPPGTAIESILDGKRLTVAEHLSLDDADFHFCIKQWSRSADPVLSDLCRRFLNRRLFKAVDLDMPAEERLAFVEQAKKVVENADYDPEYYFVQDKAGDAEHYFYTRDGDREKDLIFVEHGYSRPEIKEISEVSAAVRGLQKGYTLLRACFPGEVKDEVAKLYRAAGNEERGVTA